VAGSVVGEGGERRPGELGVARCAVCGVHACAVDGWRLPASDGPTLVTDPTSCGPSLDAPPPREENERGGVVGWG
jgi:hypothetical protein